MKNSTYVKLNLRKLATITMIVILILLFLNIFISIKIEFYFDESIFQTMKIDIENIAYSRNQDLKFLNSNIAEFSKVTSSKVENYLKDSKTSINPTTAKETLIEDISLDMLKSLEIYIPTNIYIYLNLDVVDSQKNFTEEVLLTRSESDLGSDSIVLAAGPKYISDFLDIDYNVEDSNIGMLFRTRYYKDILNKTSEHSDFKNLEDFNYWDFTENNLDLPSLYICVSPLIVEGKIQGMIVFSLSQEILYSTMIPKTITKHPLFFFIAETKSDGFYVNISPNIDKTISLGLIQDDLPLVLTDRGFYNTYTQGSRIFYGYDEKLNIFPENSVYSPDEFRILILTDAKIYNSQKIKIFLLGLAITLFGFLFLLDKKYDILNKIIVTDEEISSDYEAKYLEINRGSANDVDIGYKQFLEGIEKLSPTESKVFELYCEDFSPKEVAESLDISINTVKTHNRNLYKKLGISSITELKKYIRMIK